jgi:hypothetical protein
VLVVVPLRSWQETTIIDDNTLTTAAIARERMEPPEGRRKPAQGIMFPFRRSIA